MKITDLFKSSPSTSSNQAFDARVRREQQLEEQAKNGGDRVSISPRARQFQQISQIIGEDEAHRQKRIDRLKRNVADGSYQVKSEDVASAIARFAQDEEG